MPPSTSRTSGSESSASDSGSTPVALRTRVIYGVGGMPAGIINASLNFFLLLYYNLVLEAPAPLVGLALAIALVFDAISDPLVGYASDHLRSRWGRRHPFMYLAILPLGLLFYALWNPPLELLGTDGLFLYLLATVIPVRLILTFFEVPHQALLPELTPDYDERSTFSTYRFSMSLLGFTLLVFVAYRYFLRDTPEYANGLLNPAGYQGMGLVFAGALVVLTLLSAGGLHPLIPRLRAPERSRARSARTLLRSVRTTFSDRSLVAALVASFLIYMAYGYYGALFGYTYGYFWALSTEQISGMAIMMGVAAIAGFLVTPPLARRLEKRTLALLMLGYAPVVTIAPVALRLLGWFPAHDSPWLYPTLLVHLGWDYFNYHVFGIMMLSMLADVIDQRELATGERSEGIIYASYTLMIKATSGAGILLGSLLLWLIAFPTGAEVSEVPVGTIRNYGIAYLFSIPFGMWLGVLVLTRYRLSRSNHAATLEALRAREEESVG